MVVTQFKDYSKNTALDPIIQKKLVKVEYPKGHETNEDRFYRAVGSFYHSD